jgi:hypothetical protein
MAGHRGREGASPRGDAPVSVVSFAVVTTGAAGGQGSFGAREPERAQRSLRTAPGGAGPGRSAAQLHSHRLAPFEVHQTGARHCCFICRSVHHCYYKAGHPLTEAIPMDTCM